MTLQDYMKRWGLSAGQWRNVTFAVIFLFALLIQSCGSTKGTTVSHTNRTDSLMIREISLILPVTVPLTRADLRLNLSDVANLTPGAVFSDKNGQASVRVERRDSIIYITATCDSLQVLCENKTREVYHLRELLEKQETKIVEPPGWWETFKNNAFYIAVGMVLMLVINLIRRTWQKIRNPIRLPM